MIGQKSGSKVDDFFFHKQAVFIKTACLWKKKSSTFEPDFCPIKLDSDPWIVQPTEHYEELSIEEIVRKNKQG